MRSEVLCSQCHSDSGTDAAICRVCGYALPVSEEKKTAAENKRKAAEIAELKAKIAAKKAAEDQAAADAEAATISDAELEKLRAEAAAAGVA